MKYLWIVMFGVLLTGCSSTSLSPSAFPMEKIQAKVNEVYGEDNAVIQIPTHGYVSDNLAIAASGAKGNRKVFSELINKAVKVVKRANVPVALVVTSVNPDLSKAVVVGTLESESGVEQSDDRVTLVYAGKVENSDEIERVVKEKGFKYGFIDIYNDL